MIPVPKRVVVALFVVAFPISTNHCVDEAVVKRIPPDTSVDVALGDWSEQTVADP